MLLMVSGCQMAQPPQYFLDRVGAVKYVDKLPPWRLGQCNWDGSIEILRTIPLFTTPEEILRHEQAHSFEILSRIHRPMEYNRFRKAFDVTYKSIYEEPEEFANAVIRALRGRKDKGAAIALKFMSGEMK